MRTLSNLIVSSGSRIASRLVATISLIVLLIGKCQSKALADVLLSSHDNNLTTEEFPLDLRVTRPDKTNQTRGDLGEPLNITDFKNAKLVRDELEPFENSWTRNPLTGRKLFEGDIAGVTNKRRVYGNNPSRRVKGLVQNNAIIEVEKRWKDGIVPYVISALFNLEERSLIAKAMIEYHNATCLRFVPRKAFHEDYLNIIKADGCYSMIGRQGGSQVISLGAGCFQLGTIVHEFMHAIGFWHEHSRTDRDDHISIRWENILPGMEHNFGKLDITEAQDLGTPYDLNSLMHYSAYAFAKDENSPTIFPKTTATLGQRSRFSQVDLIKINRLYECTSPSTTTTSPPIKLTTLSPITGKLCGNFHHYCSQWAEEGECTFNPEYMRGACPESCGYCQFDDNKLAACEDNHRYCRAWAGRDQCNLNPDFMLPHCRKSCGKC